MASSSSSPAPQHSRTSLYCRRFPVLSGGNLRSFPVRLLVRTISSGLSQIETVRPVLMAAFNYNNIHQVPKVDRIVVNCGLGEAAHTPRGLAIAMNDMAIITGQKPVKKMAKKPIVGSKSRSVQAMGIAVTLRGNREDNSSKIGFLFPAKIHDVGPLTRILQGFKPSVSQLNTIVPLRRFSSTAEGDQSHLQGTPASIPDVPARIKFKRPDKTARNIMNILDREAVEEVRTNRELPDIRPGYIVQLKVEVPENKRRVSIVKGIVIARRNAGLNTTIRLRRLVAGVGVESLFPLYSPNLKEIKVLEKKKIRRAKLYYLRDKMNALKKN